MQIPSGNKFSSDSTDRFFIIRANDNAKVCVVTKCGSQTMCEHIRGLDAKVLEYAAFKAQELFGIQRIVYLCVGKI